MNRLPKVQKKSKAVKASGFILFANELGGKNIMPGDKLFAYGNMMKRASGNWARLSDEQKKHYRDRANYLNEQNAKIKTQKETFNSVGENMLELERKHLQMQAEVDAVTLKIRTMIGEAADCGELDNLTFHFISTSYFYKEADAIYPAELALAKFSLKHGVYAKISIPINPGNLPIGSRFTAEQIAKETHKFPLPENQPKTPKTNYMRLLMKILEFLQPLDRIPIFFALGFRGIPKIADQIQFIEDTHKVLSYIFEQAGEYEVASKLKVYSVYELLYELKNKIVEFKHKQENFDDAPFPSIPYTIDKFKTYDSKLEYLTKGCPYHDEMDVSKHCCLAKVQRFGFVITQWCNQMEKCLLKPNRHYPYVP